MITVKVNAAPLAVRPRLVRLLELLLLAQLELGLVIKLVGIEERGPTAGQWRAKRLGGMTGGAAQIEGEEGLFYWLLRGFSAIAGWERIEL